MQPFQIQKSDQANDRTTQVTQQTEFIQYKYRWVIMLLFCFSLITNALTSNNIPPIATKLAQTYDVSPVSINAIGMIYLIVYTFMNFPTNYILDTKGMRLGLMIGTSMYSLGMFIQLFVNTHFFFVILGSFFVAIGQPFIINAPAKIATFWFKSQNRTFATSVLNAINIIGCGFGFILPAIFVNQNSTVEEAKKQFFGLLFFQFSFATLTTIAIFIFMKQKPPTPASLGSQTEKMSFRQAKDNLLANDNFKRLFVGFIFIYGTLLTFTAVSNFLLKPFGLNNIQISVIGIFGLLSAIAGTLVISYYVKKTLKYSLTMRVCCVSSFAIMIILLFILNSFPNIALIILVNSGNGFMMPPLIPLSYDLGCQISFPVGQALVTGILIGGGMIFSFLLLIFIQALFGFGQIYQSNGIFITFIITIGIGMMNYWRVKQSLKRREAEQSNQNKSQQNQKRQINENGQNNENMQNLTPITPKNQYVEFSQEK